MHLIAAGHHVQGVSLQFPWGVISVLSCSLFLLNVNGAQAEADAHAGEKASQEMQSIPPSLRLPPNTYVDTKIILPRAVFSRLIKFCSTTTELQLFCYTGCLLSKGVSISLCRFRTKTNLPHISNDVFQR